MTTDRYLTTLLEGEATALGGLTKGTGGRTGVFTIWYRGELVYLGHSYRDPADTSNPDADGVVGRIVGLTRQPPVSVQRALADHWPQDWAAASGATPQERAHQLLAMHGQCRFIRLATGDEAKAIYEDVKDTLARTRPPLAQPPR